MTKKERALLCVQALKKEYPEAVCSLDYKNDFQLLVATRLSAQCTDARVNLVTPALFEKYPSVEAFADADVADVEELVRSCGFYRTKAKDIVGMAQKILSDFGGRVPDNIEDLTSHCQESAEKRQTSSAVIFTVSLPLLPTPILSALRICSVLSKRKIRIRWSLLCVSCFLLRKATIFATAAFFTAEQYALQDDPTAKNAAWLPFANRRLNNELSEESADEQRCCRTDKGRAYQLGGKNNTAAFQLGRRRSTCFAGNFSRPFPQRTLADLRKLGLDKKYYTLKIFTGRFCDLNDLMIDPFDQTIPAFVR